MRQGLQSIYIRTRIPMTIKTVKRLDLFDPQGNAYGENFISLFLFSCKQKTQREDTKHSRQICNMRPVSQNVDAIDFEGRRFFF